MESKENKMESRETDLDAAYSHSLTLQIPETVADQVPLSGASYSAIAQPKTPAASQLAVAQPKTGPSFDSRPPPVKKGCTTCEIWLTVLVILLSLLLTASVLLYLFDDKRDFFMSYLKGKKDSTTTTPASTTARRKERPDDYTTKYHIQTMGPVIIEVPKTSPRTTLEPGASQTTNLLITTELPTTEKQDEEKKELNDTTPMELKVAIERIRRSIDEGENPCDNFYQFSCGGWIRETSIPEGKDHVYMQPDMRKWVEEKLHEALMTPSESNESASIKETKVFYKACVDEETVKKRGEKPIKDFLEKEFGGWPMTTPDWNETKFDIESAMAKLTLLGVTPIFKLYVGYDKKEPENNKLILDAAPFILPNYNVYLTGRTATSLLVMYEHFLLAVVTKFGSSDQNATMNDIKEMVDFEIELAKIVTLDNDLRSNPDSYNPMTLEDIQGNYSDMLDWKKFVKNIMTSSQVMGVVTDSEIIINESPKYLQKASEIVNKTPKRTISNYLLWSLIYTFIHKGLIGGEYHEAFTQFQKLFNPIDTKVDVYSRCFRDIEQAMKFTVSKLYVEKHFNADVRDEVDKISTDLEMALDELLKENTWMDKETMDMARGKMLEVVKMIGYPEYVLDDKFLDRVYKNLTFQKDLHFENALTVMRYVRGMKFQELRNQFNQKEWTVPSTETNGYYKQSFNQLIFPAGILQPLLYSKHYPRSLNYGGIGPVMGHEMTHALDAGGRNYDFALRALPWWTKASEAKFLTQSQCMVDQYAKFTWAPYFKQMIDGKRTHRENIADAGGVKLAYRAYRKLIKHQGKEDDPLPGLDFTHNQLFFIHHAQTRCVKRTDEATKHYLENGKQSPEEFRIVGALQNLIEFSEAFQCPSGSYMNPDKKCYVW